MNKKILEESLEQLTISFNKSLGTGEAYKWVIKMRDLLEDYLKKQAEDIDALFKLSRAYDYLQDSEMAIEFLKKILNIDPQNAYALMSIASIEDAFPFVSDETYEKLNTFKTDDNNTKSMLEYLKGCYFGTKSISDEKHEIAEEQSLEKSIVFCDKHVWNYVKLSHIYKRYRKYKDAQEALILALRNIQKVNENFYDVLSTEAFINEKVTGIWINDAQYHFIVALLAEAFYKEQNIKFNFMDML